MITILPCLLCCFYYAKKMRILYHPAFLLNVVACFFVALLSFGEVLILSPENFFPRLDENFFVNAAKEDFSTIISGNNRYLGFIIFSHLTYITSCEEALKFQLLPFALFILLVVYDFTRKKNALWLFPVVWGYIYMLATLAMRDTILIAGMLGILLKLSRAESKLAFGCWSFWGLVFFSFLRPEYSIVLFLTILWYCGAVRFKKKFFATYFIPSFLILLVFIFSNSFVIEVGNVFYPGRIESYKEDFVETGSSVPFLGDNLNALLRQLFTPLPSSKMVYLLSHGPSSNLVLKEVFRIVIMLGFYIMLLFLLFRPKAVYFLLRNNYFLQLLFIVSVINTIFYAVYRSGGGSTRNKVFPIFLVFIIYIKLKDRGNFTLKQWWSEKIGQADK